MISLLDRIFNQWCWFRLLVILDSDTRSGTSSVSGKGTSPGSAIYRNPFTVVFTLPSALQMILHLWPGGQPYGNPWYYALATMAAACSLYVCDCCDLLFLLSIAICNQVQVPGNKLDPKVRLHINMLHVNLFTANWLFNPGPHKIGPLASLLLIRI